MHLDLYSHYAVELGGPLAVRPPDCCCFSHFFPRPLQSSQSSPHGALFSFPLYPFNSRLQTAIETGLRFPCVKLKELLVCFWRFPPKALSVQWWYVGMFASCSSALLLLLLSTIQSCQWSWLRPRVSVFFSTRNIRFLCCWDEVVTQRCSVLSGSEQLDWQLLWSLS